MFPLLLLLLLLLFCDTGNLNAVLASKIYNQLLFLTP